MTQSLMAEEFMFQTVMRMLGVRQVSRATTKYIETPYSELVTLISTGILALGQFGSVDSMKKSMQIFT
jgi:hypothetical protein